MNVTVAAGAALVLALSAAAGGPNVSTRLSAPESRVTELDGPACTPDRTGAGLTRGPSGWTCSAPAGARVAVRSDGQGASLSVRRQDGRPARLDMPGVVLDRTIEWRGAGSLRAFDLRAGILRMEEPALGARRAGEEMLAVVRVSAGRLCVAGIIDGAVTPDAASLARAVADDAAECGTAVRIHGVVTRRARDFVARL